MSTDSGKDGNVYAYMWFNIAPSQGHTDTRANKENVEHQISRSEIAGAQHNLGLADANGEGVPEDNVYAYMWWNIAASQGFADASTNKDGVERRMSQSEIAEAQRLSRECVARDYKDC